MEEGDKNRFIVIAMDGPAASGKSSIANQLAKSLNFSVVNSGNMYRAIADFAIKNNICANDGAGIADLIAKNDFDVMLVKKNSRILINGEKMPLNLATKQVNDIVSAIATIPEVRKKMNELQRRCAKLDNIICEGRDAGTVVFPDAAVKFYLDAKPEIRQKRRQAQGLCDNLAKRDHIDTTRKNSPLTIAKDAFIIDNTSTPIKQTVSNIYNICKEINII